MTMNPCRNFRVRARDRASEPGFTLVELLVVIAIIGVLLGLLLPAIQAAREAARRSECTNNLKQMGLALQNYHSQNGSLPPGALKHEIEDRVGLSWRVLILPFLELNNIYEQIHPEPDGGANDYSPQGSIIEVYHCPSAEPPDPDPGILKMANYGGVSGAIAVSDPNTNDTNDEIVNLEDVLCGDMYINGVLFPESIVRIGQITDGTSNTLAIGERLYSFRDWLSGMTWWGPDPPMPTTGWCVGAAKNINYPLNADLWQIGFYKFDFQAPVGAVRKLLLNELPFASEHSGGVNFSYADGSVHFINDTIDFTVLQAMATRNGEEVFEPEF